ncbi:hypothetical protein CTAYLR_008427 [Chrysophaeum taylorii]|uniref:ABC1 atypical kinase-like domain-containing protein n=1 Tax=Chrysophaeum taylorii TaxID=2483200 RepID=A0AAD7XPP3_9STRA|nr:hypothetical protein CTAYLR_008427 [Chrysophaeum taylorii]
MLLLTVLTFPAAAAVQTTRLERSVRFWRHALPPLTTYLALEASSVADEKAWAAAHRSGAEAYRRAVDELGGFYVKTGQIIASRQDLFPSEYSKALAGLTDLVDPLPAAAVLEVVLRECGDVFDEFDETPLGAASVAQVHRAVYKGREVAVKVQRPGVEDLLLGDVRQLKQLAKLARGRTPVDYFVVFAEIEAQLADEFDFVKEAAAMTRIRQTLASNPPLVVPGVVDELSSRTVLVMDYVRGEPLSRFSTVPPKPVGLAVLGALTEAFGRCILGPGFFHADPHPGNLLVTETGELALIDYGQVKQISGKERATLGAIMIALANRTKSDQHPSGRPEQLLKIAHLATDLGVELDETRMPEGPAAVAIWLFDDATEVLPGGFENSELSPNSPAYALTSFPGDLVLVARASVLIKGLAARLGVRWSLAEKWAKIAAAQRVDNKVASVVGRVRFRSVRRLAASWVQGKLAALYRPLALAILERRTSWSPRTAAAAVLPPAASEDA